MIRLLKHHYFSGFMLLSIVFGGMAGSYLGPEASYLKPVGDIFLNLIFCTVVPLVFFNLTSAIAELNAGKQAFRLLSSTLLVFLVTSIIAGIYMITVIIFFPLKSEIFNVNLAEFNAQMAAVTKVADILTVSNFIQLFSPDHLLPLIIFSTLMGFAINISGEQSKPLKNFFMAGSMLFTRMLAIVMKAAPIGFFAYFAAMVGEIGPKFLNQYVNVIGLYYLATSIYFVGFFSFYILLSNTKISVKPFWKVMINPTLTALATCSSVASIPSNLQACEKLRLPQEVYKTAIPLGSVLHKDGSVIGGVLKIAFLFSLFHYDFVSFSTLTVVLGVSVLVGVVMGAIPGGGMLGELFILSFYGFPHQMLMLIVTISILIDPLATIVNVTGDIVCAIWVQRLTIKNDLRSMSYAEKISSVKVSS